MSVACGQLATTINNLTGSQHTRIVWLEGGDLQWGGGALKGYDTQTGQTTTIQAATYRQTRPILCTGGQRVVYTVNGSVQIVNFDGTGKRTLVPGFASDVWVHPATGLEWVIVRVGSDQLDGKYWRYQIENTANSVQLCTRGGGFPQSPWWQVSADGTMGAEFLPYPFFALLTNAGIDLVEGAERVNPQSSPGVNTEGCWSSMASDNSYWSLHFDKLVGGNSHGSLLMFQGSTLRTNVTINAGPLPAGSSNSYYHPKFASNGGRFLTLTSNDGGSTSLVEVYFGKFNATYTGFDGWARVTTNSTGDYYPDAWVGVQSQTPSIRFSPTSLAFSAQQGGSNPANQNIALTTPNGTLSGVALSDNQNWLTTSLSGSGASYTIVNSVNITGLTAGTHTATVTATATGVASNTYTVTLTVGTPVASRIEITPATAQVATNSTLQFSASVKDQQGTALSPQPAVTWSLGGTGATLSTSGLFTSSSTVANYNVIAVSGSVRDTAQVSVFRPITITSPSGGSSIAVGSTINIQWTAVASVIGAVLKISPDGGDSWYDVYSNTVYRTDTTRWGHFSWKVPATVGSGVSLATPDVQLKIYNYQDQSQWDVTGLFTVPVREAPNARANREFSLVAGPRDLRVFAPWRGGASVSIHDLSGRIVRVLALEQGQGRVSTEGLHGQFIVRAQAHDGSGVVRGIVLE